MRIQDVISAIWPSMFLFCLFWHPLVKAFSSLPLHVTMPSLLLVWEIRSSVVSITTVWCSGLCPPSYWGFSSRPQATAWSFGSSNTARRSSILGSLSLSSNFCDWNLCFVCFAFLTLLHELHVGATHDCEFSGTVILLGDACSGRLHSCSCFLFSTWLCASWSAGTPRLGHVREDRLVCMSGGALQLFLVSSTPGAVSAAAAHDSFSWIFSLHSSVLGIRSRTGALGRHCLSSTTGTSTFLPVNFLEFPYRLNILHLSLPCIISEISTTWLINWTWKIPTVFCVFWMMGTCVASHLTSQRSCHCAVPVHWNVVNCVDGLHLMHLNGSRWMVWAVGTFLCYFTGPCTTLEEFRGACQTGWSLPFWSLSDPSFMFGTVLTILALAQQLTCHMCWLWIEFTLACSRDWSSAAWSDSFSARCNWWSWTASPPLRYNLLDMLVHNLFTTSLLDRVLRQHLHPARSQLASKNWESLKIFSITLRVCPDMLTIYATRSGICSGGMPRSVGDLKNWNVHEPLKETRFVNVGLQSSQRASWLMGLYDPRHSPRHQLQRSGWRRIPENCTSWPCDLSGCASSPATLTNTVTVQRTPRALREGAS